MSPFVEGVKDLLPEEIIARKEVYQKLRDIFKKDGYREVVTPALESLDLYSGIESIFPKEEMFKVVDDTGQILVLRPDLTMPIARMAVSRFLEVPGPWKFSYINTAYQTIGKNSALMKESTQAGVELMGREDLMADVEVISTLINSLRAVGITEPLIDLGYAGLAKEIFSSLDLDVEIKQELRRLIREKNVGEISLRVQELDLTEEERRLLTRLPIMFGRPEKVLTELKSLPLTEKALEEVAQLEEIYQNLKIIGLGDYIILDPAMVTKLSYYTGIIFKAYIEGYGKVIASGGRYDQLAKQFGKDIPAVGFAIKVENLMDSLYQFGLADLCQVERLVLKVGEDNFEKIYRLGQLLKEKGIIVDLYPGQNIDKYTDFHQISYIGEYQGNDLVLSDRNEEKRRFSGELEIIADKLINFTMGGDLDE